MPSRQARRENRIARAEAQLRYGGQINALKRARKDLKGQFNQERADYEAAGRMNEASAKAAIPSLQKALNDWMGPVAQARSKALEAEVGKLPDGLYKSVLRAEATEAPTRLTKTLADATAELSLRQANAPIQARQGVQGAYSRYRQDRDKVTAELQDLLGQSGVYKSTRTSELRTDRLDRAGKRRQIRAENRRADQKAAQDQANTDRKFQLDQVKAGINPATGKPFPKGHPQYKPPAGTDKKKDPNKPTYDTAAGHRQAREALGRANLLAQRLAAKEQPRHKAIAVIKKGTESIKGVTDEPLITAALDMAYMGRLHPETVKKLRAANYRLRDLDLRPPPRTGVRIRKRPNAKIPKRSAGSPSIPYAR